MSWRYLMLSLRLSLDGFKHDVVDFPALNPAPSEFSRSPLFPFSNSKDLFFRLHTSIMGRSKPRTNKRPPPRPSRQGQSAPQPPPLQPQSTNLPYLNPSQPLDLSSFIPPPASIDPNDPAFSAALRHWSASALANPNGNGNSALPIDLPASLAALFEAKLTLDREKQKLMRMQKELKGYREGVTAVTGNAVVTGTGKGKEVAVQDDDGECTCGRNG